MSAAFKKATTLLDVRRQAQLGPLDADDKDRYVDLDGVRGEHIISRFLGILQDEERFAHIAFAGHRGGGKTTLLKRLIKQFEAQNGYCAYFDAHPELIMEDLEYTDVLLYVAQKIVEDVSQAPGVTLDSNVLKTVENYFVEATQIDREEVKKEIALSTEAKARYGFPFLVEFLASINARISGSSTAAKELRNKILKRPDQLISNVNLLLTHVAETLRAMGKTKILLIMDSLDRLQPEVMERAFIREALVFTRLEINLIMTVPLANIYLPTGESLLDQGVKTVTLPMVAVRGKEQSWEEANDVHVSTLSELITKRVDIKTVFEPEDLVREMVLLSGGSFRELFDLLTEAALAAGTPPITRAHLDIAARYVWNAFKAPLNEQDRQHLVKVHLEKNCDRTTEAYRLLFRRFALEYNGEGWADVHPLIMRFDERFKKLLEQQPA
jgi:DNA polymerase III delta prime subunit